MQSQIRDKVVFTPQQEEAINCTSNCAVSAGAGSGKTKVLSQRFLRLVKEGTPCNRILTITFTKKATAEMKERIHKLLAENGLEDQLKLFSQAYISTVDSFCSEIAKTNCISYGLTPDFSVTDDYNFKKDIEYLASRYLEKSDSTVVHRLADRTSIENIEKMLVESALCTDMVHGFDSDRFAQKYIEDAEIKQKKIMETALEAANNYVDELSSDSKLKSEVESLTKFINGTVSLSQVVFSRALGTGEDNQTIAKELKTIIKKCQNDIIVFENTVQNADFIRAVYGFVGKFVETTIAFKRKTGQAGFNDIMQMALDILKNDKATRNHFKRSFDYVMIDEFQDNNSDHRDLLYLLCEAKDRCCNGIPQAKDLERGKFFLVGDDKQSIYRFRGADVSVFNRICEELNQNEGKVLELGVNFRSSSELVNHFSKLFEKVMENPQSDFEARYRQLDYNHNKEQKVKSRIVYHYLNNQAEDSEEDDSEELADRTQSEAHSIANLIESMVKTDLWQITTPEGEVKRPQYKDIAILLRTGSHQGAFEKALRLKGIPYSLAETKALMTEALVNDIYSILSLAVYPHDSISKAAYLKSPLCNISNMDLKQKLLEKPQEIEKIPLRSVSQALRYIWYNMGYRAFIISNPSNQVFSEHYSWLYALACDFDVQGKTVVQFLDYLRPYIGSNEKLKELTVLNEESEGVQIMTIHKSKGLEFPIVIVASMETKPHNSDNRTVTNADNTVYLPISENEEGNPVNIKILLQKEVEEKKELAELKRLFYVASTRAECHLVYSSGVKGKTNAQKPATMADLFEKAMSFDSETGKFSKTEEVETISYNLIEQESTYSTQRLDIERVEAVSPFYENPSSEDFDYESVSKPVTGDENNYENLHSEKLKIYDWDREIIEKDLQKDFGSKVHQVIENTINGKETEDTKNLLPFAKELADNFFSSSMYSKLRGMELYSEREFSMFENNVIVEGVIDLLALDQTNAIIYDFKTDKFKNPEIHRNQLETYARAVSRLYPDKKVSAFVIYLRNPEGSVQIV